MDASPLLTAIGAGCGGAFGDWLGRTYRWRALLAKVFGCSAAVIGGLAALFAVPNGMMAISLLAATGFLNAFYAGVSFSVLVGNLSPWVRSTALAVVMIAANVIAGGFANWFVGIVSDWSIGFAGQRSILYGMGSTLLFNVGGVLFFLRAMSEVRRGEAGR